MSALPLASLRRAARPTTTDATRPLRILQITDNLGTGGLEQVVVTLCRTLDRSRFEPSVLCLSFTGALGAGLLDDGIPVFQLPRVPGVPDYFAFRRIAQLMRSERIDVVHTHNTGPFMDGGLAAMLAGVRTLVHTEHGRVFPDKLRYQVAEHLLSRVAYRVVGVSERIVADLQRHERIAPRKLVVIPNGAQLDAYSCSIDVARKRRELGLPMQGPVVGVVARLERPKGISYLLQALPRLCERFAGLSVVIAGEGVLRDELVAEARQLGVADRVWFVGVRSDVPALLQLFDVYVLPSVSEGLPMSLIEAMAAGRAVVATDVGGVGTLVRTGTTGVLVPPRSPEALGEGISRLLLDDALHRRVGAAARQAVRDGFSAAAMTRRYEQLYSREETSTVTASR